MQVKDDYVKPDGERNIVYVVRDNIKRFIAEGLIEEKDLYIVLGSTATLQNILRCNTANGCSITTLQRIAGIIGVKTTDLIDDWESDVD